MFKKSKVKKSKYTIKLRDFQVTVIMNFISNAILELKDNIQNTFDHIELYSYINEKYALMHLAQQFGFTEYDDELKNRKTTEKEITTILEQRKNANESEKIMSNTTPVVNVSKKNEIGLL